MNKKNDMKTETLVTINMNEEKINEIDSVAKQMGISRSGFVRLACKEFIELQQTKAKALGIAV